MCQSDRLFCIFGMSDPLTWGESLALVSTFQGAFLERVTLTRGVFLVRVVLSPSLGAFLSGMNTLVE